MTSEARMREAVQRGCAFLDEEHPGWELRIDLGTLDLGVACTCVLGQLEGDFFHALEVHAWSVSWADRHGFSWAIDEPKAERVDEVYGALTELWRQAVKERLDRGVQVG